MLRHRCRGLRSPWGFAHRREGLWRQEQLAAVRRKCGRLGTGRRTPSERPTPQAEASAPTPVSEPLPRSTLNCRLVGKRGSAALPAARSAPAAPRSRRSGPRSPLPRPVASAAQYFPPHPSFSPRAPAGPTSCMLPLSYLNRAAAVCPPDPERTHLSSHTRIP